jgi:hypothetical protein
MQRKETMSSKASKTPILTFAELEAMTPADLFKLASENTTVAKAVDKAKDKFTNALKPFAKVVAAMKRVYTKLVEERTVSADTSFKKFFKDNASGELPGRAESLAALFNTLVLVVDGNNKPLLPEAYFDKAAVDWLEKANAIIKTAKERHGEAWKTCDDVLDTITALSEPGDAAKELREIRKRQKGDSSDTSDEAEPLTVSGCIEFLKAAIAAAKEMPEENAAALYAETRSLADAWAAADVAVQLDKWETNIANGVAPHMEVRTPESAAA